VAPPFTSDVYVVRTAANGSSAAQDELRQMGH
jgi:hypothetical protein